MMLIFFFAAWWGGHKHSLLLCLAPNRHQSTCITPDRMLCLSAAWPVPELSGGLGLVPCAGILLWFVPSVCS